MRWHGNFAPPEEVTFMHLLKASVFNAYTALESANFRFGVDLARRDPGSEFGIHHCPRGEPNGNATNT